MPLKIKVALQLVVFLFTEVHNITVAQIHGNSAYSQKVHIAD